MSLLPLEVIKDPKTDFLGTLLPPKSVRNKSSASTSIISAKQFAANSSDSGKKGVNTRLPYLPRYECCFIRTGVIDSKLQNDLDKLKKDLQSKHKHWRYKIEDFDDNHLWSYHVNESKNVVVVLGNAFDDLNRHAQDKTLRLLFSYMNVTHNQNIYFLVDDFVMNRLALPTCLNSGVHFVNPNTRGWMSQIVNHIDQNL